MVATRIVPAVFGILAWGSAMAGSETGDIRPDPTALIKDLETIGKLGDRMTLVLWLPTEFWRVTLESGGKVAPDDVERFTKAIDPYVVVAIADGQTGILGSVDFSEPEVVRKSATIENSRGEVFSPLPDDAISDGVKNLTQMMRPVVGNSLGSLGSHITFVVFPGTDKEGLRTVEATKDGVFIVHVGTQVTRYRLPLGSLLPPAIDQKTGETFPGNFHFNPYSGNRLSPAPGRASPASNSPLAPRPSSGPAAGPSSPDR
jgi:hypothetical protein